MTPETLTALIVAVTALVVAVTGLLVGARTWWEVCQVSKHQMTTAEREQASVLKQKDEEKSDGSSSKGNVPGTDGGSGRSTESDERSGAGREGSSGSVPVGADEPARSNPADQPARLRDRTIGQQNDMDNR